MEGLVRNDSNNNNSDNMGWDDYVYDDGEDYNDQSHHMMVLDRATSTQDGPKLTRGFSFTLMDKDEIEKK
jgi:hypothetical protein